MTSLIDDGETTLARQAVSGDAEAFGELVARNRRRAMRVATVVLGHSQGADDVVQDASQRAWRAITGFDATRGFRAWYLRVVANTARNARRTAGRRAALELRSASSESIPHAPDPAEVAVTQVEREMVVAALNRMGEVDRLVLALRFFEHLSEAEMAVVLACAPGTVKSRLSRAMGRLRAELELRGEEDTR